MMKITFSKNAWEDYLYWQKHNKKMLRKINNLIKDIQRNPFDGIGKPEALKYDLAGFWSRRIDQEHRLIFKYKEEQIFIYACKFHYD